MAATLTIVNQHGQTLAAHRLGNTPLSIRAQDQVQYQLAGEGGLAPANVEAARAGNDLLVHIDGQQALRIEDYFLLDDSGLKNPLLGMNESGQYVTYDLIEAPNVLPVEHVLAEEVAGVAASEGASVSALTAFGIGTLALGGLALAAQSSNENNATHPDKEQPQTPFDPNQPTPPPADNGNTTPPPAGGGNTNPPPSGGGNTTPPPSGGGNNNLPPSGGGNTNPPPSGGGNTTPPPAGGGNTNPPPSGGGNTNPPPQAPKPNGSITIEGDAKVGQTLTAKISDADGVSDRPQYQWLADGQAIANATQSTYTLTAAEKGKAISVQATYTDGQNTPEKPSSAATAPVIEETPAPPPPAADTTAPTLAISATPSTLTPGGSTQLTFKVSEPVKGFTADDVIVQGGTLSNFHQVDAKTFTATFIADAAGKASVTVVDDAFVDLANNPNELANLELVIGAAPTPPTPQNHAPSDITLSAYRLPENQAGAMVGKLTTNDPDQGDTHTYAVNDNRFEVDAQGNLKLKDGVKVEFAQEKTIALEITTTDKSGASYQETFTINVQDDPNHPAPTPPANQAPTDITLSANGLPENQAGAVIGKLATVDPDANDNHTYAVNDQRFEVDAQGNLKLKDGVKVEFAQEKTIALEITTTDKGGASYQETFTINVQDDPAYPAPNQRPTGEVRINGDVLEGQTLSASHTLQDPDGLGDITYIWKTGGQEVGRGATYVPKPADIGKTLTVTASYTDGRDHAESVESNPSQPVAVDNRPVLTLQSLEDSILEGKQTAYNLHLSKALDAPIEVELRLVHIDTDRKDFLSDQPWSVTIEAGQTDLGVFLRPLRDSADESAESYRVEIAGFSGNVRLGADSSVTTRIEDNTDPAQAGTMPAPVDISTASGKLVFQPDKNASKMRIYYTSPAGEDKFFDFGAWEGEWSDYSSFPPGSSFDPETGRTEIPVNAFKTGSEIIAWAADNTRAEPYESLNSVRVNANGGISPAASAKPQGARLFAADKALIGEESLLDLDNLGSIQHGSIQHGSEGQDTFVIDSECLLDSGCITVISGFNPGHGDLLQLESSVFTALDKGTLAQTAFVVGDKAGNAEHRVIYNADTGELAYDPDGSGAAASTVIARFDPALELEAQHIVIM